jgi:hypothetical protein
MKRFAIVILAWGLFFALTPAHADWTPAKRLTWTSGDSFSPAAAVDSTNAINLVWADYTPGNSKIYFKRSEDGGATWTEGKRLTWTSGDSYEPAIALDSSDTIHVVWDSDAPGNYELFYMRSSDGGISWRAPQRLTWSSGWSEYPSIAIDSSDYVHIVWQDDKSGNLEIHAIRSTNGGTSWSAVKRLTWTSGASGCPDIIRGTTNTVHIVWQEDTLGGCSAVFFKKSSDGGLTWGASKRLTPNAVDSLEPAVAQDSGAGVYVVYVSGLSRSYICYRKSTDGGTTWSPRYAITCSLGQSEYPAVAVGSDGAIHVIWDDDAPGNHEIYHEESTNGGTTWGYARRLTWSSGASILAAIAEGSGSTVHIVWEDNTPGNSEIYYKNGN